MIVSAQKVPTPEVFIPFSLTIEFQSQKEADKFYAIMNHTFIIDGINFDTNHIRNRMRSMCDNISSRSNLWIDKITETFKNRT